MPDPSSITVDEAARLLAVGRWQFERWLAAGQLTADGDHIDLAAVEAFARSLPTEPVPTDDALDDPVQLGRAARLLRAGLARPKVVNGRAS